MFSTNWLRDLSGLVSSSRQGAGPRGKNRSQRRRQQPVLEVLEDRTLLASHLSAPVNLGTGATARHDVVVVDPSVTGYQALLTGLAPGTQVVTLSDHRDGVQQLTAALGGRHDITSIHVIA